jgi:methyl-accepting chemotaxis protein
MEKIESISADTIRITEQLGKEANEIGKITDTIKTITDQTNLLALNAAIEAARAGEHGRGFGVVAEEIRQLAENNNQSAKMIELLIQRIHSMIMQTIEATTGVGSYIKEGRKIVENVHMELQNITTGITHINDKIQNIAASTEEQSTVTEELSATMETINGSNMEIATAVVDVASSISGQTDTISQLSAIASELNNSAELLSSLVNNFKLRE